MAQCPTSSSSSLMLPPIPDQRTAAAPALYPCTVHLADGEAEPAKHHHHRHLCCGSAKKTSQKIGIRAEHEMVDNCKSAPASLIGGNDERRQGVNAPPNCNPFVSGSARMQPTSDDVHPRCTESWPGADFRSSLPTSTTNHDKKKTTKKKSPDGRRQ